jgi:hypothetical protein
VARRVRAGSSWRDYEEPRRVILPPRSTPTRARRRFCGTALLPQRGGRRSGSVVVPLVERHQPLRVACYHRVSRLDQNPRLQEDETLAFIERRGWTLVIPTSTTGSAGRARSGPPSTSCSRREEGPLRHPPRLEERWPFWSLRHMVNTLAELDAFGVSFASVNLNYEPRI